MELSQIVSAEYALKSLQKYVANSFKHHLNYQLVLRSKNTNDIFTTDFIRTEQLRPIFNSFNYDSPFKYDTYRPNEDTYNSSTAFGRINVYLYRLVHTIHQLEDSFLLDPAMVLEMILTIANEFPFEEHDIKYMYNYRSLQSHQRLSIYLIQDNQFEIVGLLEQN